MKISLNWIRQFVDIPESLSPRQLAELLTLRTCEVEGFEEIDERFGGLRGIVVGELKSFEQIPNTEKLHIAQLDIGQTKPLQVIFGKMIEMRVGDKIPVAVAPVKLPTGIEVAAKMLHGVLTEGMLCLDQELGLKSEGVSIHYFPFAKPGTPLADALRYDEAHKYDHIAVGKIKSVSRHPNADRLNVAEVDVGSEIVHIVCGGQNLVADMLVAVALPGAVTLDHDGGVMVIKKAKIRGEESFGMICAEEELGLPKVTTHPAAITIADMKEVCAHFKKPLPKVGTPLAALFTVPESTRDVIFEIDNKSITHRPDLWGHYGMAREFAAFLGKKLRYPEPCCFDMPKKGPQVKIDIKSKELCSRFQGVIISGVKVERSPTWLVQKLEAVGMRPINNIVDITNYVMLELGHPLHAFDRKVVGNDHFVIRMAQQGERIKTLDGKERTLSPEDTLVTNGSTPLALAGVMGGELSGISNTTTEIILEVATWNPIFVRKTAQRHVLRTDAAQRFEKSLDPVTALAPLMRACQLITEICQGAALAGPVTDLFPSPQKPLQISLNVESTQKKIGAQISAKEMTAHLTALGFSVKAASKDSLKVTVPSFRATKDINIEDDLVEEVARMHGYEKITPMLPALPIRLPHENYERSLKHRARDILSRGLGIHETLHYSFYGAPEISKCMLPEAVHIKIKNPLTADQTHMRISLIPNMLKSIAHNLTMRDTFTLYEIGRTYIKANSFMPHEEKFIAALTVRPANKKEIFYDALGQLETVLHSLGIHHFTRASSITPPPYAHPSKCVALVAGNQEIAIAYELHPEVLKKNDIASVCAGFEVNFTKLAALAREEFIYTPLPRFPGISFDISVLVDKHATVREVSQLAKKSAGELARSVTLIDTFEGPSLGEDKKSLTLRIALQSAERTLTDAEMKESHACVCTSLTKAGYSIRG